MHVLPTIRTFTVGPGVSPGQPAAGCGRVADCYRRFGVTPTPEHVRSIMPLVGVSEVARATVISPTRRAPQAQCGNFSRAEASPGIVRAWISLRLPTANTAW